MAPTTEQVNRALGVLRQKRAVAKYLDLQAALPRTNVAQDFAFQRAFNGYYRIRYRSADWRRTFYERFEAWKARPQLARFPAVLADLLDGTQRYEASFGSKLVASLDPSAPVWDSKLMTYWALGAPAPGHRDRLKGFVHVYETLRSRMTGLLASAAGQGIVRQFDEAFPAEAPQLTAMKKLDLVLWQIA
jgi:hypothetical protein